MSELEAARVAADAAESSRAALQQQLSALVEQKERAELSTDMVTRQTQVGWFKPLQSHHEGIRPSEFVRTHSHQRKTCTKQERQ